MRKDETLFGLACFFSMLAAIVLFWRPIPDRCASALTIGEMIYNMIPIVLFAPLGVFFHGICASKEVKK